MIWYFSFHLFTDLNLFLHVRLVFYHQCCCPSVRRKIRTSRAQSSSARELQLEVAGSLELGSLRALPAPAHLLPLFLPSPGLSLALPSLAATTGRAAAPFITSSPSPLPATSILQVCPPLLFPSAVRDGAPQTLTKLFVFGSESIYNILPTNFDSCWVRPWFN